MNIANRLTAARIVLAPVFFLFFFLPDLFRSVNPVFYSCVLLALFTGMELTDLFDGRVARKHKLVTDLGKVMDPFGDVIIHLTFFTCLLSAGYIPVYAFMLIIWREFCQSFMRMLLMGKGKAMGANIFGKSKTCFYCLTCMTGFIYRCMNVCGISNGNRFMALLVSVLCILAAVAAVLSFAVYIRNVVKEGLLSSMTR